MSSSANPPPSGQTLPAKEQGLFRQVVKCYENKQYKKAIKAADQILKKFPDHGETLAMKGLTLNSQDKKEESYELVRKGLKCDLKSHVCWHVYGLLYRSDRNYREAIKCYLNALRLDKDNAQILRDLANLQIQMRDLQGYVETRHQLLTLKSNNRNNWISFAVAHHVNGNYDMAVQILEAYERTLDELPASEAYEHSEMLMYKSRVLREGGRLQEALQVLDTHQDKIRDRWAFAEARALLLLQLGRLGEAEAAYRAQLALNPDHYKMHEGLQAALGLKVAANEVLTDEQRAALSATYCQLQEQYPRSSACKRIPLDFLVGPAFSAALDAYVRPYLRKGIPSLFVDVRPLYKDQAKAKAVQDLFEQYNVELRDKGSFPADPQKESPQARVWVQIYLAQHYDHLGHYSQALACVDDALQHTPTVVELYTIRAKILKHAGAPEAAAHVAEAARRFDLSDRYLNSVAVKALLGAGRPDAADMTAALFVRDGDQPVYVTLYDMQHMWYEVAAGACHWRAREIGKALKKYIAVTKHFEDIHEDQFDFHGYCMRKMTLRAYIDMLRMEDQIYGSEYYSKAACGAVRCYLALHDKPPASDQAADDEALMAGMSAEERKKYKLKKKKEEKQRAKEAEEAAKAKEAARLAREAAAREAAIKAGDKKKNTPGPVKEKDADPEGAKLAATDDPLGEATKLVAMLKEHGGSRLTTHLMAFEVYSRKQRLLLALSAVQRAAAAAGPSHPEVHVAVVRLAGLVAAGKAAAQGPAQPVVAQVLEEGLAALLGGQPLQAYCASWQSDHGTSSIEHRVAAATASVLLDPKAKPQALQLVLGADLLAERPDHATCMQVHEALLLPSAPLSDAAAAASFKHKAAELFPHSSHFEGTQPVQYERYEFDNMVEAFGKLSF